MGTGTEQNMDTVEHALLDTAWRETVRLVASLYSCDLGQEVC